MRGPMRGRRQPPGLASVAARSRGAAPVEPERALVVAVERLTYGFDALAHADGQVVLLPYAAPGDEVEARVTTVHTDYLRAEVARVTAAGPERVLPGCPAFTVCGGCQWQHVSPAAQRAAKAGIVAEQLARIAGVRDVDVAPTVAGSDDWRYRARITLVAEGRRLGYHRARSHRLVEIDDCPIADAVVAAHVGSARAWVAALRAVPERVTIAAAPGGVVLTGTGPARPGPRDVEVTEELLARTASVRGAVLAGGGTRIVVGDPRVRVDVEPGVALEAPADVFTQVNPAANVHLVQTVLAVGAFAPGVRVLDLYCGAGNFSLPIARRGAVVEGVEQSTIAVEAARANAARLGLDGATFTAARVRDTLAARQAGAFDVVVLDPPRAGAADELGALAALRAPRIVYVACDPATLARDVRTLVAYGYRTNRIIPVDLFPQTYHIETVAELVLT